ncbi:MAG: type IV toxin-antitoxin system AbiEi family antitoxin domain-containing protein [Anaerolineae bacterium]
MSNSAWSRTLGEQESQLLSRLAAAGRTLFTVEDARAVLSSGDEYADADVPKLLYQLHRKGWIKRLERGTYRIVPLEAGPEPIWAEHDYLVAASLVSPYYLAYSTALHYYGYTERAPDPLIVATTRRKQPVTIEGVTYRFVTLTPHKFFGYAAITLLEQTVQMAEEEKAIADGFDHPALVGGVLEPAKGLWLGSRELDFEKLVAYQLRLGNRAAARRLGFWLEKLDLGTDELLSRLEDGSGHSYAPLEPGGARRGARNARWRLIVNVPERQLLEWQVY